MTEARKIQIAILGGGCGAIAAAYELTASEELRARYAVTVYQQGWRLGGKGASGRNAAAGNRIEEHGLHMWLGFYQNAFAMIRSCYAEWVKAANNPFQDWDDAFTPQPQISLGQRIAHDGTEQWDMWNIPMPPLPGTPGDGKDMSLLDFARALSAWLAERHSEGHPALGKFVRSPRKIHEWLGAGLFDEIKAEIGRVREALSGIEIDINRIVLVVEIGWTILKGLVDDVLPYGHQGFRRIDHLDFREWMIGHGLSQKAAQSAPIRTLYDLGFAYRDGDYAQPQASAGVVLYATLNIMFGSRGATLFRMNAGMGDTVFTPLYEVLSARGVRFAFFNRVVALHLSPDGNLVQSIDINRQVDLNSENYNPLVQVPYDKDKMLPCWPSEPDWSQIKDGAAISAKLAGEQLTLENIWCTQSADTTTLRLGRDFDHVVLGISLAGLKGTCDELIAASPPFAAMVENLGTVQTQAMQLWFNCNTAGLGWTHGSTVLTGYADPQSTWADMSHLLRAEPWSGTGPASIAYFCGPMAESSTTACLSHPSPPTCATGLVGKTATAWLNANSAAIWPKASGDSGFNWGVLYDPGGGSGPDALASQYLRANIDPSERYVLSLPGTVHYRLDPGNSGFANLYLAGDWTETRMNSGCVEAAVESGMRAARAISGFPRTIFGEGIEG